MEGFIDITSFTQEDLDAVGSSVGTDGIFSQNEFSFCIVSNKVLTVYYEGEPDSLKSIWQEILNNLKLTRDTWKYIYFCMMYLSREKNEQKMEMLIPFISNDDLCKLCQRREIKVIDFILQRIDKKEIIRAAMQHLAVTEVFIKNGWRMKDENLLSYYDVDTYRCYDLSVMICLAVKGIEDITILKKFVSLARERDDYMMMNVLLKN